MPLLEVRHLSKEFSSRAGLFGRTAHGSRRAGRELRDRTG